MFKRDEEVKIGNLLSMSREELIGMVDYE